MTLFYHTALASMMLTTAATVATKRMILQRSIAAVRP